MSVQEQLSQALSIAGTPVFPQIINNATVSSGSVNMAKFERVLFILSVGSVTSGGSVTMQLQYSPDNSTWTNLGGAVTTAITASSKVATAEVRAGQLGSGNTYVRANVIEGGSQNCYCSCVPLGGDAHQEPAAAQDVSNVAQRLVM